MGLSNKKEDGTWDDINYDKASKVCSKSRLKKQAGNAICKNVLMAIFNEMLPIPKQYLAPKTPNDRPRSNEIIQLGNIKKEGNFSNPQTGRVYSIDGVSPTLNTCGGAARAKDNSC